MNWPLLLFFALAIAALAYLAAALPRMGNLVSRPRPAADYAEAQQRVTALQAQEASGYNSLCHTQLLAHGQKTARCIAFIHGYTNCPRQFNLLAQQFHGRGYNTLTVPCRTTAWPMA